MAECNTQDLVVLFTRDLDKLSKELHATPAKQVWKSLPGVVNSCGVLSQHLVGNLNHYIGACLGNTGYERNRPREFEATGISKSVLKKDIRKTSAMVENVLTGLTSEQLGQPYEYFSKQDYTVRQFLRHLYGHMNYHLGQIDYLRRILSENNG